MPSTHFDAALSVLERILTENRPGSELDSAMDQVVIAYTIYQPDILVTQVKRVVDVLWRITAFNGMFGSLSARVAEALKPVKEGRVPNKLWPELLRNSYVTHSLLLNSYAYDMKPTPGMSGRSKEIIQRGREESGRQLFGVIPRSGYSHNEKSSWLDKVAHELLGDRWDTLQAVYEIPRNNLQAFGEFLAELPESALAPQQQNEGNNASPTIPSDIV